MKKQKNDRPFKGMNKVQFLAAKEEIVRKIGEGYNLKKIWQDMRDNDDFSGSYNTFRLHHKNLVQGNNTTPKREKIDPLTTPQQANSGKEDSLEEKLKAKDTTASIKKKEPVRASTVRHEDVFQRKPSPITDADKDSLY